MRYFTVFVAVTASHAHRLVGVPDMPQPGWLFIAANAFAGLTSLFLAPFLVPFTIEADPSRRAALQSGAAQSWAGRLDR